MNYLIRMVVLTICSILVTLPALAKNDPLEAVFVNLTQAEANTFANKYSEGIEKSGLPIAFGYAVYYTARDLGKLTNLGDKYKNPEAYAKAWVEYSKLPAKLSVSDFLRIRDSRGLYFLPSDYSGSTVATTSAGNNTVSRVISESVGTTRVQNQLGGTRSSVMAKPNTDENIAPPVMPERVRIARVQNELELARKKLRWKIRKLEEQSVKNKTYKKEIDTFRQKLDSTNTLLDKIKEEQKLLTKAGKKNATILNLHKEGIADLESSQKDVYVQLGSLNSHMYLLYGLGVGLLILIVFRWNDKKLLNKHSGYFKDIRKQFTKHHGRLNKHDEQIDSILAKMLNLPVEDAALISKKSMNALKEGETVSIQIPIKIQGGVVYKTFTAERIKGDKVKVNIPRDHNPNNTHQIVSINTGFISMIDNAVNDGRISVKDLENVA